MTIYHTFSNHRNKKIHEVSKPVVENNFKAECLSHSLRKNDNNITRNSGFLLIFIILTVKHSYFHLLFEISKTKHFLKFSIILGKHSPIFMTKGP